MIGDVTIGRKGFDSAVEFYGALLATMGIHRLWAGGTLGGFAIIALGFATADGQRFSRLFWRKSHWVEFGSTSEQFRIAALYHLAA